MIVAASKMLNTNVASVEKWPARLDSGIQRRQAVDVFCASNVSAAFEPAAMSSSGPDGWRKGPGYLPSGLLALRCRKVCLRLLNVDDRSDSSTAAGGGFGAVIAFLRSLPRRLTQLDLWFVTGNVATLIGALATPGTRPEDDAEARSLTIGETLLSASSLKLLARGLFAAPGGRREVNRPPRRRVSMLHTLTCLQLDSCQLTCDDVNAFMEELRQHGGGGGIVLHLRRFSLRNNPRLGVAGTGLGRIAHHMQCLFEEGRWPCLEAFDVSLCEAPPRVLSDVIGNLSRTSGLIDLDLSNNNVALSAFEADIDPYELLLQPASPLTPAPGISWIARIRRICISGNLISKRSMGTICRLLPDAPHLQLVEVSRCFDGFGEIGALHEGRSRAIRRFVGALRRSRCIGEATSAGTSGNSVAASAVRSVDLSSVGLDAVDVRHLAAVVAESSFPESFLATLEIGYWRRPGSTREGSHLIDPPAAALTDERLWLHHRVAAAKRDGWTVNLRGNPLGVVGMKALLDAPVALQRPATRLIPGFLSIFGGAAPLTDLDLAGTQLSREAITLLCQVLELCIMAPIANIVTNRNAYLPYDRASMVSAPPAGYLCVPHHRGNSIRRLRLDDHGQSLDAGAMGDLLRCAKRGGFPLLEELGWARNGLAGTDGVEHIRCWMGAAANVPHLARLDVSSNQLGASDVLALVNDIVRSAAAAAASDAEGGCDATGGAAVTVPFASFVRRCAMANGVEPHATKDFSEAEAAASTSDEDWSSSYAYLRLGGNPCLDAMSQIWSLLVAAPPSCGFISVALRGQPENAPL